MRRSDSRRTALFGGTIRHPDRHSPHFLAVLLLLALSLLPLSVAAATDQATTPIPVPGSNSQGITIDHLIASTLGHHDLASGFNSLTIAGIILPPGATVMPVIGAHLFVVEGGTVTASVNAQTRPRWPPACGPVDGGIVPPRTSGTHTPTPTTAPIPPAAGPSLKYGEGEGFLVVTNTASSRTITNEGTEPAAVIAVSIATTGCNPPTNVVIGEAEVVRMFDSGIARVGRPLVMAGRSSAEPISVTLDRLHYERDAKIDLAVPAARVFLIEEGAVNVLVGDPASYFRAVGSGVLRPLPSDTRVSLVSDDYLLIPAPGRVSTQNVARGSSEVLTLAIATSSGSTPTAHD